MSSTRDLLIDELEKCVTMGGRYERIRCVNFDRASGNQVHGHFSLVFWAWDRLLGKAVALKFFDPDQTFAAPSYRMRCFEREPELLKALLGKQRCLQLVQSMASHTISVPTADPKTPLDLQFAFFAVEWLEDSIDEYFERQQDLDALTKLKLFHDLLLAVAAIHKYEIFHRDVKPDNFRAYLDNLKRIVVAIDLVDRGAILLSGFGRRLCPTCWAPAVFGARSLLRTRGPQESGSFHRLLRFGMHVVSTFQPELFSRRTE